MADKRMKQVYEIEGETKAKLSECEDEQIIETTDLLQKKKESGDDLYSEMRDKLSIQEDLITEWADKSYTYKHSQLPKE